MANNFKNPWENNTWAKGGKEYKKSAVGVVQNGCQKVSWILQRAYRII